MHFMFMLDMHCFVDVCFAKGTDNVHNYIRFTAIKIPVCIQFVTSNRFTTTSNRFTTTLVTLIKLYIKFYTK